MNEEQMRDMKCPWPKSRKELNDFLDTLEREPMDYGKCVYAMSLAATASFYYMSSIVGSTGFQASCADLDFLKRVRGMKSGFSILDYDKLLYPQYCDDDHFPTWRQIIDKNKEMLAKKARELLAEDNGVPAVRNHWEYLASLTRPLT